MSSIDHPHDFLGPQEPERDYHTHPATDAELNAKLAKFGVQLRPPAGKPGQFPPGWLPGDEPVEIELGEGEDYPSPEALRALHPSTVFDMPARVRFLDALAGHGNVRAAAALVGVSRETVYRARRRFADFARLWDAALVHARGRSEEELATRALDGVAVPVFVRGEHVATYRKHDARYLLAHLARLDRRVDEQPEAAMRAERFDELLAVMAGHDPLPDAGEAVEAVREPSDPAPCDLPPSREEYIRHARCEAMMGKAPEDQDSEEWAQAEAEAMAQCEAEAAQQWDEWIEAGAARVDRLIARQETGSADSVTCVNTPTLPEAGVT